MTIIAAIGSPSSADVVEQGYELAEVYDDRLVVLHVFTRDEFDDRADGRTEYYLDDATYDAAQVSAVAVDAALPDDPANVTVRGRIGDPAEEILDEAYSLEARYVVVGGRKRSPVGKAMFGSTTQSILLNAVTPVVTIMDG